MSNSSEPLAGANLETSPAAGQTVTHKGVQYTTIKEGRAHILVPPNAKTEVDPKSSGKDSGENAQNVFYNPIQQFNRDLSVLAIRAFAEDFSARRKERAQGKKKNQDRNAKKKKKAKAEKRDQGSAGVVTEDLSHSKEETSATQSATRATDAGSSDQTATGAGEQGKDVPQPPIAESEGSGNAKKRKSEEINEYAEEVKKQKIATNGLAGDEGLATTDEARDHTTTTGTSEAAEDNVLNPAKAAALPKGQRPDDKLRSHLRILDALSATGLRALRYASELPIPTQVVANDLVPAATNAIKLNVSHNRLTHAITATTSNAQAHMYSAAFAFNEHAYGRYDVIDLDPYGTAVPFIEPALLALNDNGLLCVTCTDAGVFNSMGYLEKTYSLYGGIPVKGFHAHEAGLRLILHSIATSAAKHGLSIEPLLSLSIDFYARVFVRVRRSPADVKLLASKTMIAHSCDSGCGSWALQPLARTSTQVGKKGGEFHKYHPALTAGERNCEHCGFKTHLAGPMWGGPLHNPWFIGRVLGLLPQVDDEVYQTKSRIEGMLSSALEELEVVSALNPESGVDSESGAKAQQKQDNGGVNGKRSKDEEPAAEPASPKLTTGDEVPEAAHANPDAKANNNGKGHEPTLGLIPAVPPTIIDSHPFYFQPSALSGTIKCQAPPEAMIKGALRHMGYTATRTHAKPGMIKTDASWAVIWEVMREWVRQKAPVKDGSLKETSAGFRLLYPDGKKEAEGVDADGEEGEKMEVDGEEVKRRDGNGKGADDGKRRKVVFDEVLGRDRPTKRLVRYQVNPRANWGPMTRARG